MAGSHIIVATLNLGRASSVVPVRRSMEQAEAFLREKSGGKRLVVLNMAEMDEGDKGYSDHALLREIFSDWRRIGMYSQDPTLLLNSAPPVKHQAHWAARGLPGQSPTRKIYETWLDFDGTEPLLSVINGHYFAGCKNGTRPPRIKEALCERYERMFSVHKSVIAENMRSNRHVFWGMDVNWRAFPKLHVREQQMVKHAPDYLRAVAAPGWRVRIHASSWERMHVEPSMHGLLWSTISFVPEES